MSAALARKPSRPAGNERLVERPRLSLVAPLVSGSGWGLTVVVGGFLALGMVSLLLVSIMLAKGEYRRVALEREVKQAQEREQTLNRNLQDNADPATLARRAKELGMHPDAAPKYLNAQTGEVSGGAQGSNVGTVTDLPERLPVKPAVPVAKAPAGSKSVQRQSDAAVQADELAVSKPGSDGANLQP